MENLIYTAVVLGNLAENNASAPGAIAAAVRKLHALDSKITEIAAEEDRSGIDHTDATERLFEQAGELVANLRLFNKAELYYTDELASGQKGRLRLEITGTPWDADAPLYFL